MSRIPDHGYNRYCNHGCRCDVCRQAMRLYQQVRTARAIARAAANPALIPHGTDNGYTNYWCRCPECGAARNAARRAQRARRARRRATR